MTAQTNSLTSRILSKQWSFFWAGIGFGIAQIVYMVVLWVGSWDKGKDAVSKPITVTTDLGEILYPHAVGLLPRWHPLFLWYASGRGLHP